MRNQSSGRLLSVLRIPFQINGVSYRGMVLQRHGPSVQSKIDPRGEFANVKNIT